MTRVRLLKDIPIDGEGKLVIPKGTEGRIVRELGCNQFIVHFGDSQEDTYVERNELEWKPQTTAQ